MRKLAQQPMNQELLEKSKLKILLQNVQGYEANSDIANYYANQYSLFRKNRYFENIEEKIEAVTVDDISRVVQAYLTEDKAVAIVESPTLTYTQLYVLLSVFAVISLVAVLIVYLRTHAHFRARKN